MSTLQLIQASDYAHLHGITVQQAVSMLSQLGMIAQSEPSIIPSRSAFIGELAIVL